MFHWVFPIPFESLTYILHLIRNSETFEMNRFIKPASTGKRLNDGYVHHASYKICVIENTVCGSYNLSNSIFLISNVEKISIKLKKVH